MTDYIENMMKTAGVETQKIRSAQTREQIGTYRPMFTAEKQLEIIKLIVKDNVIGFLKITQGLSKDYIMFYEGCKSQQYDFAQALAQLTTELMKANELDKEKVKGILEG